MSESKDQNDQHDSSADWNSEQNVEHGEEQIEAEKPEVTDWEPGPPTDGSPPDYYTAIKSTDFPTDIPPPPEYEPPSVQGVQGEQSGLEVLSLAYADFLPRCIKLGTEVRAPCFDSFKTLIGFANEWLRNNRQHRVIRCESIIRKLNSSGLIETDSTTYHQSLYGTNDYVRGLRFWLVPNLDETAEPQQIAYLNIMPKDLPSQKIPIFMRARGLHGGMTVGTGLYTTAHIAFPDFEDLQKTCERFNNWVQQYPLPGKMLSLESLDMFHSEFWSSRCLDPDEGFFREKGKQSKLYLTMLRLFYVLGDPQYEEIGIEDFNPEIIALPKNLHGKPKFEQYTTVLQRAGIWAYNQNLQHMRILNVNTIDTKLDSNIFRRPEDRFRIDSNKSFYNDPSYSSLTFVKTIRVCYAKVKNPIKEPSELNPITLTSKTFVATRLGGNNVTESLSSLVYRVNAWINATGVRLVCVDTVKYEYERASDRPVDEEKVNFTVESNRGHYWIVALRLYLDGLYKEPPPQMLPPPPEKMKSNSCRIL